MNLANKVPQEKRIKVLEAINILNNKYRSLFLCPAHIIVPESSSFPQYNIL